MTEPAPKRVAKKSKLPVLRGVSWPTLAALLALVASFGALGYWLAPFFNPTTNIIVGMYVYLAPVIVAKAVLELTVPLRGPVRAIRRGAYDSAIALAERTNAIFTRNPRLDRWRGLLFFEPAKFSYREAALSQIVAANLYAKRKDAYHEAMRRFISAFPDSALADGYRALLAMTQKD